MSEELVIDGTETLVIHDTAVELLEVAQQGPMGPPGLNGAGGIEFPLAWGDASPRTVTLATAGKLVYGVQIHISEAFDGTGVVLQVGDAGQADRLMAATQNSPVDIGTYTTSPNHIYGSSTSILLTITPGAGATTGAGLLTIFIES